MILQVALPYKMDLQMIVVIILLNGLKILLLINFTDKLKISVYTIKPYHKLKYLIYIIIILYFLLYPSTQLILLYIICHIHHLLLANPRFTLHHYVLLNIKQNMIMLQIIILKMFGIINLIE